MDLAVDAGSQTWPQIFRQLVVDNSRYWLRCAQENVQVCLGEAPQLLKALSYALALPDAWDPTRDLMLRLNPLMIRQGHGIAWEGFLVKGIRRSSERQDPAEIELRLELGNFYRLQGRLPEAHDCLQEALVLCERYQQQAYYWTLINQLGLVARLSGQHTEALARCQQVLAEPTLSLSERAEALNVIGLVAYDCRQWAEALDYFDQTLTLYQNVGDAYQIARLFNNRGLVLLQSGRWDEAEVSYQEAIHWFQAANDQVEHFKTVMNLGNVFLMKQTYEAAIEQYQKALPVFRQYNYVVDLAHTYNNLGMAYTGLAAWQIAEPYFLSSIELWQTLGDKHNLANVLDNFGDMFIRANQPKRARKVLDQALQILSADPTNPANTRVQRVIEDRLSQLSIHLKITSRSRANSIVPIRASIVLFGH